MSERYESDKPSLCRFCCKPVRKGDKVELIKLKGRKVLIIHTECYEAEKAEHMRDGRDRIGGRWSK